MQEYFFFPPPPDGRSPFRLHLAGSSRCDGSYRVRMNERDFYFVFEYVEKGRGQLVIDGMEYFPQAGDLYIVPNIGKREYWSDAGDPWIKHWFNVSGPLIAELLKLYSLENVHLVHNFSRPELFTEGLERLSQTPKSAHLPLGPEILGGIIAQAAADLLTAKDKSNTASAEGTLLRDYLDGRIFRPMPKLAEMAEVLHLSAVQTIRIFRRDFGEPPYAYLLKRKLAAAQELLHCTRRSIKEIALSLHFTSEYYFAGLFKKKTGLAPGRYRKMAQENPDIRFNSIVESPDAPGVYINTAMRPAKNGIAD